MRYDTPIYFQKETPPVYDPTTGDYSDEKPDETKVYASVMNTGTDTVNLLYGEIRQDSLTVHIQNHYTASFDKIRIGAKQYKVDKRVSLRTKEAFILSEVQNGT